MWLITCLGRPCFSRQELHAAEKEFREALRVNASADNHFSLAACLMSMDRYQEALSEIDMAAKLDPERTLVSGAAGRTSEADEGHELALNGTGARERDRLGSSPVCTNGV